MKIQSSETDFVRIVNPCRAPVDKGRTAPVFCKIKHVDGKLTITGVIGPMKNGDAIGPCGQIDMGFKHRNPAYNDGRHNAPIAPETLSFTDGWDTEKWYDFLAIWDEWHLNDLRAGCIHQRAEGWHRRPIDPSKPLRAYGKHFPSQRYATLNMLARVRLDEHPDGLLGRPCGTCGYKYGSAWLKEPVPAEVLDFLSALPETAVTPAWI